MTLWPRSRLPAAPLATQGNVHFQTQQSGSAQVHLYNALGVPVATLHSADVVKGQDYYLPFSGEHPAEGVYFCRLVLNGKVENHRFVIQH